MLNQTIISSIQITVPLLAESITKHYSLDSRWVTVFQMTFNSMLQLLTFNDDIALYIIIFLCTIGSVYYLDAKTNGIFSYGLLSMVIKRFTATKNGCFIYEYDGTVSTLIEKYLYKNPNVFDKTKPSWIFRETYRHEENGISTVSNKGILKDGCYQIAVSNELKFDLTIGTTVRKTVKETIETRRIMEYKFIKGDEHLLIEKCINQFKETRYFKPNLITLGRSGSLSLPKIYGQKHNDQVWFGYYHPRKEELMKWVKNVDTPLGVDSMYFKFSQPRQFSVLCHGKAPGTGKSSLLRKIAQFTHRHVVRVNLLSVKKLAEIEGLFYRGVVIGETRYTVNEIVIELDEFDKTIKKLKLLKKYKQHEESVRFDSLDRLIHRRMHNIKDDAREGKKGKSRDDEDEDDDEEEHRLFEYDWDIDDLLTIICGSYIPDGRIIVGTCNDIEVIKNYCPQLVRANRMTPIAFDYGDKELFFQIIKDYLELDISKNIVPDDFRFSQAGLTEFLVSHAEADEACIIANLSQFEICPDKVQEEALEKHNVDSDDQKLKLKL